MLDPPRRRMVSQEAAGLLARMLEASEDAAMQQFLRHVATNAVRGLHFAPLIGQLLSTFLQSSQRDRLLDDTLTRLGGYVEAHRTELCSIIADRLPWARLLSLVRLDEKVAGKFVDWFGSLLQKMRDDRDDVVRQRLIERLEAAAQWLMHSEEASRREASVKDKLLGYEALLQFLDESWHSLKRWLLTDLRREESDTCAYLDAAFSGLGEALRTDQEFVTLVQRGLQAFVVDLAARHRDKIGALVTTTVGNWSVIHMVDTIEREVGTDLQFIRINGTVVGGLVGLVLYGAALLIGNL